MKNTPPIQPGLQEPHLKKRGFLWFLIPTLILVGFVTLTPLVLSTQTGTRWLVQMMNKKIDHTLSIDSMSLSLWGEQSIQGMRIVDANNNVFMHCSEIKSDRSLWIILLFHEFGICTLTHPEFYIRSPTPATTPILQKLQPMVQCGWTPSLQINHLSNIYQDFIPRISGKFNIIDGRVEVISPHVDPIFFSELNTLIHISKKEGSIKVQLHCLTNNGSIQIDGQLDHLDRDIPSILLNANLSQLPVQGIDRIVSQFIPKFDGLILNMLGKTITMNLQASFDQKTCQFAWNAQSPQLIASIAAEETHGFITLQQPADITLTLTPTLIQTAAQVIPSLKDFALEEASTIALSLQELTLAVPEKKIDWTSLSLKGLMTAASPLALRVFEEPFILESLTISLDATQELALHAQAQAHPTSIANSNILLSGQLKLTPWISSHPSGECQLHIQGLPIDLMTKLSRTSFPLADYLGPSLDCSLEIDARTPEKHVQVTANSELLQLPSLHLTLGKTYQLTQPAHFTYYLSPTLFTNSAFHLAAGVPIECSITSLTIPPSLDLNSLKALISCTANEIPFDHFFTNEPHTFTQIHAQLDINTLSKVAFHFQGHPLKIDALAAGTVSSDGLGLKLEGSLSLDPFTKLPFELTQPTAFHYSISRLSTPFFLHKPLTGSINNPEIHILNRISQEQIDLTNFNLSINKETATAPISFDITTQATATKSKAGSLSLKGTLDHLVNANHELDLKALAAGIELKITQFPSCILDFPTSNLPFSTIFGNTLNATLSTALENFSGPLSINIHSPHARASLTGKLVQGGLTLDQSVHIQGLMTPAISRLFLNHVNPLNISSIFSQDPITLEIPSQNFYFPLYPFDIQKVNIPKARVELGKIHCRNEGNLHIALGLLKSQAFDKTNDLTLWFAPLDLNLSQGILEIERTEVLLAETFDIAIWGNVDLMNQYVDMILGLTAQSLYQAFGIQGLPANYVLTIPMKGPAENVQINSGKATAKIALLLAWQQKMISGALGGGTTGAIVEGLIGKLATLPDQDAKIPPPKHPFPWEIDGGLHKKKTADTPSKKKKHFKSKENPIKQLIKILT